MWSLFNQTGQLLQPLLAPLFTPLFTPPCLLCGSLQANFDNYCPDCYQDLPHRLAASHHTSCRICTVELGASTDSDIICGQCLQHPPAYDEVISGCHYLPPITSLMHAFKDQGQQACGKLLSACLLRYVETNLAADELPQALIPMPLHFLRQRQRGFNQADIIAEHLGKALRIPILKQHCLRHQHNPSQQGQNKRQRGRNLTKAFQVKGDFSACQHVAIIDDVVTTGSTAQALSKVIKQACQHDIHISVWSLARTLPPHSQLHLSHYE